MSKSILFIFAFKIILILSTLAQSEDAPGVICAYAGKAYNVTYKFSPADIPERCKVILYSFYYFDTPFYEEDKTAIKDAVTANKIVYTYVTFDKKSNWPEIMNSDPSFDSKIVDMEKFLTENSITGVVLQDWFGGLFAAEIMDYAQKMNAFICKIKAAVPSLKVGILLNGYQSHSYSRTDLFNFTATNDMVDFYFIDATTAGVSCNENTTSRYPITTNIDDGTGLDEICEGVYGSTMSPNKLVINFLVQASYQNKGQRIPDMKTYSEYCNNPNASSSAIWCADNTQTFYDEANYVKKYFKGIALSNLEFDDVDETCGCGKFPVTNTFIDGFQSMPIKCCDKIA